MRRGLLDSAGMDIQRIVTGAYQENAYLVFDGVGKAAIVDPGEDAPRILAALRDARAELAAVLLTHGHIDHIAALPALLASAPAPVHVAPEDAAWCFTERNRLEPYAPVLSPPANLAEDLADGAEVRAGALVFRVLATPGHSPGSVCFLSSPAPSAGPTSRAATTRRWPPPSAASPRFRRRPASCPATAPPRPSRGSCGPIRIS